MPSLKVREAAEAAAESNDDFRLHGAFGGELAEQPNPAMEHMELSEGVEFGIGDGDGSEDSECSDDDDLGASFDGGTALDTAVASLSPFHGGTALDSAVARLSLSEQYTASVVDRAGGSASGGGGGAGFEDDPDATLVVITPPGSPVRGSPQVSPTKSPAKKKKKRGGNGGGGGVGTIVPVEGAAVAAPADPAPAAPAAPKARVQRSFALPQGRVSKLVSFDIEITGNKKAWDEIISIAVVVSSAQGVEMDSFVRLIRVSVPVDPSPFILGLHGISNDMVKHERPRKEVLTDLLMFLKSMVPEPECGVLVAHNGPLCDFIFLAVELNREGLELPGNFRYTLDTLGAIRGLPNIYYHAATSWSWLWCGGTRLSAGSFPPSLF